MRVDSVVPLTDLRARTNNSDGSSPPETPPSAERSAPVTRYDHGHPVDESRRCWAKTKTGRQCLNNALVGKAHCALHGGQAATYQQEQVDASSRVADRIRVDAEEKTRELNAYAERQLQKLLRRPPTDEETQQVMSRFLDRRLGLIGSATKGQVREAAEGYARARQSVIRRGRERRKRL